MKETINLYKLITHQQKRSIQHLLPLPQGIKNNPKRKIFCILVLLILIQFQHLEVNVPTCQLCACRG